jgi:transcription elongation factor GreB
MVEEDEESPAKRPNYITPAGFQRLRDEYHQLLNDERPKLCKVIEWAAGNGDRSENADYIYGKKRLREIDRRLRFLGKRIEHAQVVDVKNQKKDRIYFGATVTLSDEDGNEATYQIVGEDETDAKSGKISWLSPLGKAILGKKLDDEVVVKRPSGEKTFAILAFDYH